MKSLFAPLVTCTDAPTIPAGSSLLVDVVRSYAAGFIFTTSLPPTVLAGAYRAIDILMSDEGRILRARHQENVKMLRNKLKAEGFPVEHTPSHIIPIRIGDPEICSAISDRLMTNYGHYVQAINYPTVARGEEKLRMAPTPFHTEAMMNVLIKDMIKVWDELEIPRRSVKCGEECTFCKKPLLFDHFEKRVFNIMPEGGLCNIPNCPQAIL